MSWWDHLRSAATTPLVPRHVTDPAADAIDNPAGDYGPTEARVRGFAAGALEGVRQQTSPINLLAMLPVGRGLRTLRAVAPTPPPRVSSWLDDIIAESRAYRGPSAMRYFRPPAGKPMTPAAQALEEARNAELEKYLLTR